MSDPQIQELLVEACQGLRGVALVSEIMAEEATLLATYTGGNADHANSRPNDLDTRFATASAGKSFVAVAIMQLVEQGRLALSDSLSAHIDFDVHESWRAVTIAQLLNHTSGVPDYFDESVMSDYADLWIDFPNYRVRSSRDLLPLFAEKPALYPAGERFSYNNSGYVLLGLVIESVTEMLFDEYLAQSIFGPAGMIRTGYYELDRLPQGCATNYIKAADGQWYSNIYSVDVKGTGAGGAFTTVEDIARYWAALVNGDLVSAQSLDLMWSVQASEMDENGQAVENYGYGFWLDVFEQGSNPRFEGYDPGVSFVSSLHRETGQIFVAVSNYCDNVWAVRRGVVA